MKVRDVMTSRVVSVSPDTSILDAGELMLRYDISGLPVVDTGGHLVGIVTARGFLRPAGSGTDYKRPRWFQVLTGQAPKTFAVPCKRKIAEVMTTNPITVTEDTPLEETEIGREAGR